MIDTKSKDFQSFIHSWCQEQRIKENTYIRQAYNTPRNNATLNFFRNPIINNQLNEAYEAVKIGNSSTEPKDINNKSNESSIDSDTAHITALQQNEIAKALMQENNLKLLHLYEKLKMLEGKYTESDLTE